MPVKRKNITWAMLSQKVGCRPRNIPYPSFSRLYNLAVEIDRHNYHAMLEIVSYQRFLQQPKTPDQRRKLSTVLYLTSHLRKDILK